MAIHTNIVNMDDLWSLAFATREQRQERGADTSSLLEDIFLPGERGSIGGSGGTGTANAPRTSPIEFWWENENLPGFIVNKPAITITPSNQGTDNVTVRISNWGDSDEQLYAVTPL
jgi:hypothetical protein